VHAQDVFGFVARARREGTRRKVRTSLWIARGKPGITVCKDLLYDTLTRLGLDTDPANRTPSDQQIVLLIREVLDGVA